MANGKRLTSNRSLTFAVNLDLKVSKTEILQFIGRYYASTHTKECSNAILHRDDCNLPHTEINIHIAS